MGNCEDRREKFEYVENLGSVNGSTNGGTSDHIDHTRTAAVVREKRATIYIEGSHPRGRKLWIM